MGNAGARQPRGEDKQRPYGDHGRTAEAGQRLLRGNQSRQCQGGQHQQSHHIHTQPAAYEQDERGGQNRKQHPDIKRQDGLLRT